MFQGLRTVVYHVEDVGKAKHWWTETLGQSPYFDEPFYVGFNVGGYELGLHPAGGEESLPVGALTYWGVVDIEEAHARLLERGATPHRAIQEVGGGIKVATVTDPSGNLVGIIENPHFRLPGSLGLEATAVGEQGISF